MKVSDFVSEILSRCGEGYENWADRAKSAIKYSIYDLVRSGAYDSNDYFGLLKEKSHNFGADADSVGIGDILTADITIHVERILVTPKDSSLPVPANYVTARQLDAIKHNAEISGGMILCYALGKKIYFNATFAEGDTVTARYVAWDSDLEIDTTIISHYFAGGFIADLADRAVKRLLSEIDA